MDGFTLKAPKGAQTRKRVKGRGTGCGKGGTSGKGNKGQNARAGGGVRPGFEGGQMPLYRRIARRGFSNYPFKQVFTVINLLALDAAYDDGDVVDLASLAAKGLIKRSEKAVKILGTGEITKKLAVKIPHLSASAQRKITAAGGSVVDHQASAD